MAAVRELADRYTTAYWELDPCGATMMGALGHDDALTDHSPEGQQERARVARSTLVELARLESPTLDDADRRCAILLRERLEATIAVTDAGEEDRSLNNIASPVQELREVFDVMPFETEEEREVLAARMAAVPQAWQQYQRSLEAEIGRGQLAAPR